MTVPSSYPTLAVRTGEGAGSSVGGWVGIGRKLALRLWRVRIGEGVVCDVDC